MSWGNFPIEIEKYVIGTDGRQGRGKSRSFSLGEWMYYAKTQGIYFINIPHKKNKNLYKEILKL